jgi:class 3 adenylate cyclase
VPREYYYRWEWTLKSPPEQLWQWVANTDRFNRDTQVPAITMVMDKPLVNARRHLRMHRFTLGRIRLIPIEWDEDAFEWIHPYRFGVVRNYTKGPMKQMRVLVELNANAAGGTDALYHVWATPAHDLFAPAVWAQVGILSGNAFKRAFRHYDEMAQRGESLALELHRTRLAPGGKQRLQAAHTVLIGRGVNAGLVDQLFMLIERGDDLTLMRLRPYALADAWHMPRRAVLEACLHATRVGVLDLRWELLCPLCRGAKEVDDHLDEVSTQVHCDVCNIDYEINFEQNVELTFRPNPSARIVEDTLYCMGGPQVTPHVVIQQVLQPDEQVQFSPVLEQGRYRARVLGENGGVSIRVDAHDPDALSAITITCESSWDGAEWVIAPTSTITLHNNTASEHVLIMERTAWSDQAVTAAEVTLMQVFRDLFSTEALKPGSQIKVGSLTVMFTDLRGSTRMYRQIGDAPAFGVVINHFDVLKNVINSENGAIVKTIGDAVMAVFPRPVNALRAALKAQEALALPTDGTVPLTLKVGINTGHSIAVTLNERLDYFGTTVNLAARLADLSRGDVVISDLVFTDPEVSELLYQRDVSLTLEAFDSPIRGFDEDVFTLHRVRLSRMDEEPPPLHPLAHALREPAQDQAYARPVATQVMRKISD